MTSPPDSDRQFDYVVILTLLAVFLFASPFILWWSGEESPWYVPYLLWLVVILLGAWINVRSPDDDA